MRAQILRWIWIIVAALTVSAGPILIANYVLSHHALSSGRTEIRAMAHEYAERAELVIVQGLNILRDLRVAGRSDCSLANRQAFGEAAFNARFVQQIGIVDDAGTLLCGEPMGSLTQPIRLPTADPGDPSVMLGVLTGAGDDRQAVVTLRAGDGLRLVARLSRSAFDLEAGPAYLGNASDIGVFLEDGSTWYRNAGSWRADRQPDAMVESITSSRFPLKVVVAVSVEAVRGTIAPLFTIVVVVASLVGLAIFVALMWMNWRHEGGDTFTRAVRNREFVPYYQPVYDLVTGEVRGCEVLVRWMRPDGSMVPPGQFLPYAEATGLIREITRQLMEKTVEDIADIYSRHPGLKLSVNLTAMHFNDLGIIEEVRQIYGPSGVRFEQLCFEVTEQHPLKDLNLSRTIIGRIQAMGCSVALDDVGTGHGGLAYLQKLGVDIIKIDKMFIDDIGTDHSSQTIVDTLVELGTQLGLGIIAEGVERKDQADYLKGIGVTTAQGYLFSPPLPATGYLALLREALDGASAKAASETAEAEETKTLAAA